MGQVQQPRFCAACGSPLVAGTRFCTQCGAAISAPRKSPYRILKVLVPVWLVLLVVAAGVGWGSGWLNALERSEDLTGTSAGLAIERYGEPRAFWLTDGPGTPGEQDYVRLEQWLYPDAGVTLTFYDGQLIAEDEVTFTQEVAEASVSPTSLSRWMRRSDVEGMLGEKGTPLEDVDTPYPELEAFAYPRSHLLVGYLDGMFFSAQAY